MRPNKKLVNNIFLWFQINSDFVYSQAQRKNMGSTVGHVNVADVKKFKILCPPLEIQNRIGDFLICLTSIEEISDNKSSDNLFQTLIQKAFNGELVN